MQSSRIDLVELKAQIAKRVGVERSKKYFFNLNRFVSHKLSKSEFDRSCFRLLGKENLQLHNQFIRSILSNAIQAKTAPPTYEGLKQASKRSPSRDDGYKHGGTGPVSSQSQNAQMLSNGVFPLSPRKFRSGIRDRKSRERLRPLGPNGLVECVSQQSTGVNNSDSKIIVENGELTPCDYERPLRQLHRVAEQPENETERGNLSSFSRSSLLAPLGIPYCSASIGGARKATPVGSSGKIACCYSGGLPDTDTLRKRMEQIAAVEGLGGVSMDCANTLNNMLDLYLKKLIQSCMDLVGSRSNAHDPQNHPGYKQHVQSKIPNGFCTGNHSQEQRPHSTVSLRDFKVAMELNPSKLGEDWPLQLEKISMQAFEE